MNKNAAFLALAAAILLILFLLSSSNNPPVIPADDVHKSLTSNPACAECHAPGKRSPLKQGHPPKEQCLICHKMKK